MAGEDPRYFQKIFVDENVGFAVFTTELIPNGTAICKHKGDCISLSEAKEGISIQDFLFSQQS